MTDAIAAHYAAMFTPEELASLRRAVQLCETSWVLGPVVMEQVTMPDALKDEEPTP
jgi:hypothetical protein